MLFFYTDVLDLPAATAGFIYMAALIWDAALDPLLGVVVDRTRTRMGRYRPYLLLGERRWRSASWRCSPDRSGRRAGR
ncbi:MFS transporter [Caulobacter segnis]